jgi:hypothetical protein
MSEEWTSLENNPDKSSHIKEFYISRFTTLGISLFIFTLVAAIIIQQFHLNNPNLSPQIGDLQTRWFIIGPLTITILIVLLGLEVDIFRWRGFTDWGALGAFVAYLGQLLFFLPIILYLFYFGDAFLYWLIIIIGCIIIVIGFTSHATEWDQRIEDQLFLFWAAIKNFDVRKFFSSLLQLIRDLIIGTVKYIWLGLKGLRSRIKQFLSFLSKAIKSICSKNKSFHYSNFTKCIQTNNNHCLEEFSLDRCNFNYPLCNFGRH